MDKRKITEPCILFEDADILVCFKPAFMAAETAKTGEMDLVSWLRNHRAARGEKPYIGMVHRLDQPVEGLMVFGKTPEAAANLSKQVQNRTVEKIYRAIGSRDQYRYAAVKLPAKKTLTSYLTFDKRNNLGAISDKNDPKAAKAVLAYEILWEDENDVCFSIRLMTGRHHQIRLQLLELGFPIKGDLKYGGDRNTEQIALCSVKLGFYHPVSKEWVEFEAAPCNPVFSEKTDGSPRYTPKRS